MRGQVEDDGWTRRGAYSSIEVDCPTAGIILGRVERDGTFLVRGLPKESVELRIVVGEPTPERRWRRAHLSVDLRTSSGELGRVELPLGTDD